MAKKRKLPDFVLLLWLLRILSLLGIAAMLYLSQLHFTQSGSAVCELGEGFSCETVNTSKYSEVLGIPVAFLGVGYFALVLLLSFMQASVGIWQVIFFLTIFTLIPALYLTATEIFVIKSICVFCELSKALMLFILATSIFALKQKKKLPQLRSILIVIAIGAVAAGLTWYLQTRPTSNISYDNLTKCMTRNNVVMYSSITCAVCARVRDTLGDSYKYVNVVECHPKGENPQPELCLAKRIEKTPTWTIEVNGKETARTTGFTSVDKLAKFAGCEAALKQDRKEAGR